MADALIDSSTEAGDPPPEVGGELASLCDYVATALDRPLPGEITEKAKHHLIDTVAAMVTGARLPAGELAIGYVRSLGGTGEAMVVGTALLTTAVNAALANGMLAHADETDDSHAPSLSHPGCVIVPAALAMAEREGRDGVALLRAVVLGYDVLTRVNMALGPRHLYERGHGPYSIGGAWGAAAAAGALGRIDAARARFLFSNIAQQTSGIATWITSRRRCTSAGCRHATASAPPPWSRRGSRASMTCSAAGAIS